MGSNYEFEKLKSNSSKSNTVKFRESSINDPSKFDYSDDESDAHGSMDIAETHFAHLNLRKLSLTQDPKSSS